MHHTPISQTIRVGITRLPDWGGIGVPVGTVERGVVVLHEAANIMCNAAIPGGLNADGTPYEVACRKRVGHVQPEGEQPHVVRDIRMLAAPYKVAHTRRFAPNRIPAGVNLDITAPHDCANHLD